MQLEEYIKKTRADKNILLMTHIVLGYTSLEVNREVIRQMVENGVDLIEMQIPFSEPMADGPVIVKANQEAIETGTKVRQCFDFAAEMTAAHDIPFLFMTYYNILYQYGVEQFFKDSKKIGIKGFIIPDLPPEEGEEFFRLSREYGIDPIMIYAPTSTEERMKYLAGYGSGFIYCVARKGVTGKQTDFDKDFGSYMKRCRNSTTMPLAVGFGISSREDVETLVGIADIAVIGTKTIKVVEEEGIDAVGSFISSLR
ncbi:MAG: tryptophan synthase subunit alpha [Desulfobulbaceae bacterium]|uniref:Tryptophan synthase alpha chain n=1 Tax=Candidatus Desulfobia pelagia TaxID=2841692 RepID=A0A8J6TDL1_9BACT|nr:tryptophan synthase subunit alpha [Candidatus Desulfobia pelagia]